MEVVSLNVRDRLIEELVNAIGKHGSTPPSGVMAIGGFDGTYVRRVRTDADGHLQIDLASALPTGDNWIGRVKLGDGTNTCLLYTSPSPRDRG